MKNYSQILITILFAILVPVKSYAQTDYYVESDPFAFALSGHSLHVGIEDDYFRFQVGMFGATLPDAFKSNDKFDVEQSGYGVKLDYFSQKKGGFFVGATFSMSEMKLQQTITDEKTNRDSNLLGVRTGYKFRINKTFYIMPWVGVSRNISDTSTLNVDSEEYKLEKWTIFPTAHLGMQF